ncbi:MAG TPA: hypothetical protein PK079_06095 [Leptospiraceae bacterium]|nr:hypothetical protein [Leptospiraceae bacterium]HMW05749.1 hypothetical protein [Leptospiraceae bacterium]HMX32484.1 hypothetical protein [Leptospiraceae bacterium]HMY30218.1 hypothetical protein [Leptospiraceae bacterium]HMZ67173.1 hypothetical protein [Leptospiraceae bacterium]
MIKKILFSLTIIAISVSVSFCGKKEEPKEEVKEVKEEAKQADSSNDLSAKIKAYEDFVTKFCALSEKMKGASVAEKATMSADFAKDSGNLKTLEADLEAAKASPDEKARIAAASKKASGCAAVAAGGSAPSSKTSELPVKTPSIPGM